jgi:hypothetical protein
VRQRVVGLGGEVLHLGQIGVGAVAAEVSPQRRVEFLGAVGHHRLQGGQLAHAPLHGTGRTGPEVGAVPGDQSGEFGDAHGSILDSCWWIRSPRLGAVANVRRSKGSLRRFLAELAPFWRFLRASGTAPA